MWIKYDGESPFLLRPIVWFGSSLKGINTCRPSWMNTAA
jgi:hypothetical protein